MKHNFTNVSIYKKNLELNCLKYKKQIPIIYREMEIYFLKVIPNSQDASRSDYIFNIYQNDTYSVFTFFLVARVHILSTTAYSVFLFLHATLITFSFLNLSQRTLIKFLFIRVTLTMLLFFPIFFLFFHVTHTFLFFLFFILFILSSTPYSALLFFLQTIIPRSYSFSRRSSTVAILSADTSTHESRRWTDPLLMKSFVYRVTLFVRMSPISSVAL